MVTGLEAVELNKRGSAECECAAATSGAKPSVNLVLLTAQQVPTQHLNDAPVRHQ